MAPSVITRPGVFASSALPIPIISSPAIRRKSNALDLNASFGAFLILFYIKKEITSFKSSLFWFE
jgi:hypothetical protein